jgi:hypothetical protein
MRECKISRKSLSKTVINIKNFYLTYKSELYSWKCSLASKTVYFITVHDMFFQAFLN